MWLAFTARFDWRAHPRQVIVFKEGMRRRVTRGCAQAAIAAGAAVAIPAPNRDEARQWLQAK